MKTRLDLILTVLLAVLLLSGCNIFDGWMEREYQEDLLIELTANDGMLIVKEWSLGLAGGAEIYYQTEKDTVFLGNTQTDDGYLAFRDGEYTIYEQKGIITVSWNLGSGNNTWRTKDFVLTGETGTNQHPTS